MATESQSSNGQGCGKGHSKCLENKINYGFSLVEGLRHKMEDFHVAEFRKVNSHELGLFAIYDGHSSDSIPRYLKNKLFENILNEVCIYFLTSITIIIIIRYHLH